MTHAMLGINNLSKYYNGVCAIEDINFEIKEGEVLALVGENGAGKSTLIKILTGIVKPSKGTLTWSGEEIVFKSPEEAISKGIAAVHQELTLVGTMSVAENIWLGHEPTNKFGLIDKKELYKSTERLLDDLDLSIDIHIKVDELSLAEKQIVELIKALSFNPKLLILDEASSTLSDEEVNSLYQIVQKLVKQGKSVIFVSHRMNELFRFCHNCVVLKDGRFVKASNLEGISENNLIEWMTGRKATQQYPEKVNSHGIKEEILRINNLTTSSGLTDVNFSLYKGEILGIGGLQGHGQLNLIHALFGLDQIKTGQVLIENKEVKINHPKKAIEQGIQLIPQDRKKEGLFIDLPVSDNIIACTLRDISSGSILSKTKSNKKISYISEYLKIKFSSQGQLVKYLSGGNQQKIALGRWLLRRGKILMLVEPTRGIDVNTKVEIYQLLRELTNDGYAIIIATNDLPELIGISDRVIIMYEKKISKELTGSSITEKNIVSASFGREGEDSK